MSDDLSLLTALLAAVTEAVPSVIFSVDRSGIIENLHITRHYIHNCQYFNGANFFRSVKLIFGAKTADIINKSGQQCFSTKNRSRIKFKHLTIRNLVEHFQCNFTYYTSKDKLIVYIQNITDAVLISEEFTAMSEQYETVNRELCAAMSNLDFKLMDLDLAHKKLAALYRVTSTIQKTVNEPEVLAEILNGITRDLGFADSLIMLVDENNQELSLKAHNGQRTDIPTRVPIGEGIVGCAAANRELIYVDDTKSASWCGLPPNNRISEVAVPLIIDDKVLGVLDVQTADGHTLQSYDLDLLRSLASQISITIDHANHVAEMEIQAITDGLTGLYNYRYFKTILKQEFKRALRYKRPLAMFMIDVDYFKQYNDTNGHRLGDEVLHMVASIIKQKCRDVDFTARYGGEEFAVLLPETTVAEARIIAERIRVAIANYPFTNGHLQPGGALTISIGISGYPEIANTDIELIDFSDAALYKAKRKQRNIVCTYDKQIIVND